MSEKPDLEKPAEWTVLWEGRVDCGGYATIHCQDCGKTFNNVSAWLYNYCPYCGKPKNACNTQGMSRAR